MKLKAIILAIGVAVPSLAVAADMPVKRSPQLVGLFDWSGFTFGAEGGYGFASADSSISAGGGCCTANTDPKGWLFGGYVGAQRHYSSNFVLGVEASLAKTNLNDSTAVSGFPTATAKSQMDYFGTAEVKLGYAWGTLLPYVMGGVAYGRSTLNLSAPGGSIKSNNFDNYGYVLGVGID